MDNMNTHWYYLHINGTLIHKILEPDPSDFVVKIWKLNINDKNNAWDIIIESLALGADINQIKQLTDKWKCDKKDLILYLEDTYNNSGITPLKRKGMHIFIKEILKIKPQKYWDWLISTPKGSIPDINTMPEQEI